MRGALLLVLALQAGCSGEADFSERYDAASKKIGTSAKEIDVELEKREKAAEPAPVPSGTGSVPGDAP